MSASKKLRVDVHLDQGGFELDVAFETHERVTGLFGASGSGKTSLLEAIAGLRPRVQGTIGQERMTWLDSKAGERARPEQRSIGYVPQDGLLFPHLSVRENLHTGRRRAVVGARSFEKVFEAAVELFELGPLLERRAPELSGGERQRAALARALCSGPGLLLLDEPFASLDLPLRRRLLSFLRRIPDEFDIPALFVSHDPVEIQALCQDLIVLRDGRILARGRPDEVLTDPAVYALADHPGFENVLRCELVETSGGTSRVRFPGSEVELVIIKVSGQPGDEVLLGLPAHEIIIATERPQGLSARNLLAAHVTRVRTAGSLDLVTLELDDARQTLTVEVTDTTVASMGLALESAAFLVFKATSCRVYGD